MIGGNETGWCACLASSWGMGRGEKRKDGGMEMVICGFSGAEIFLYGTIFFLYMGENIRERMGELVWRSVCSSLSLCVCVGWGGGIALWKWNPRQIELLVHQVAQRFNVPAFDFCLHAWLQHISQTYSAQTCAQTKSVSQTCACMCTCTHAHTQAPLSLAVFI